MNVPGRREVHDLFCGMGGWGVGHGYDIDPMAVASHPDAELLDVRRLPPITYGGIVASPPCQDYSIIGSGKGRKMLHRLVAAVDDVQPGYVPPVPPSGARLTLELMRHRPDWLCAEQVPDAEPVYLAMARRFQREGYHAWAGVVSAEQWGLGQRRRRAVLLVSKDHIAPLRPTHAAYPGTNPRPPVTMGAVLADLDPAWNEPGWWWTQPSPTVMTKNTLRSPRKGMPDMTMTVQEMAALQGLPVPPVSRHHAYRLIGNAIPPVMARALLATVGVHDGDARPDRPASGHPQPPSAPAQRPQR